MKNIIIVVYFGLLTSSAFSQTEKGRIVLSGKTDLNFLFSNTTLMRDSIDTDKMKSSQYGVTIGCGYFIADNLLISLSGAYSYTYTKAESGSYSSIGYETITTTLGVVPQISYYFPLEGKLKPSLSIGAGYIWMKERNSNVTGNNNIVYSFAGPSYNGGGGLSYFITESVAFDLGLQYTHNRLKDKVLQNEIQKQNVVAGTFGVSVFF